MKYKLELTQKQIELLEMTVYGAFLDTLVEEGKHRSIHAAAENKVLKNILAKIQEVK